MLLHVVGLETKSVPPKKLAEIKWTWSSLQTFLNSFEYLEFPIID